MHADSTAARDLTPPLSRRERQALDAIMADVAEHVCRRLPLTLELVGVAVDVSRSDLAGELVDEVARRRRERGQGAR
jgi:hypothetical protein